MSEEQSNNEQARLAVGLDVGGTNARAALVSLGDAADARSARIVAERRRGVRDAASAEAVVALIAASVDDCLTEAGAALGDVAGVGMGLAAQLSADGRTVHVAPNLGWRDVALATMLEDELGARSTGAVPPVRVVNDLSAIVWGEYRCGAARGVADVLAVYVGTGIGGGLILRGSLYEGSGGTAGEIGHAKLGDVTARCGCGQTGCVEAVAGGRALEARLARDLARGAAAELEAFVDGARAPALADVEGAAAAGVSYAVALWRETAARLGDVVGAALGVLNPAGLLLGGGVLENAPTLRAALVERLRLRTVEVAWRDVEVLRPQLGDDAGVLGAALLVTEAESMR